MTLEELKQITEDYFGVEINPKDRKYYKVKVRFLFYHTAYRVCRAVSLNRLGGFLGQNHATVIHAIKELPNIVKSDKEFARAVEGYYKMINLVEQKDFNVRVADYEEIKRHRGKWEDVAAREKVKELKSELRTQRKIIKSLTRKLKYYEELC